MKSFRCFAYFSIILSIICVNTLTFAAVIYVPADQPTIQAGIDAARDGDTVLVADGIYRGEGNVNIDFKGKQINVKSQNGAESTTVDCEKKPDTRGFIFQNSETNDSVLDGITIINGIYEMGGGIFCDNASPTIKNCVIDGNQATADKYFAQGGGGIYCLDSAAVILGCTITNNIARHGAGVLFEGCLSKDDEPCPDISLINCIISHNTGGGVFCTMARPNIRDCTVSHNKGTGITYVYLVWANKPIFNCVIEHNSNGGVSSSEYCSMSIEKSIIRYNTRRLGAGISCSISTVNISYCIIAENVATEAGGGIYVSPRWDTTIEFCTITQNKAHGSGGGIFVYTDAHFSLSNSIIWGNEADISHSEAYISQYLRGRFTIKANDINGKIEDIVRIFEWDRTLIEGNIHEDPLFIDAAGGNYRVKPNSPAYAIGAHSILDGLVSVTPVGNKVVMWADLKRKR